MKKLTIALFALALTGCSVDASIFNMDELPSAVRNIIQEKPGGAEFVSGSTGADPLAAGAYAETVPSGYKVQATVGHFLPRPVLTSTGNGYKVYSTVQGTMISQ